MKLWVWRFESSEEARQRRLCRKMLMLPPEPEYHHVLLGFATLGALGLLLAGALVSVFVLGAFTSTVLQIRRRYRHVVAGVLVLAALLSVLLAAVHRYGYAGPIGVVAGPTPSALASSGATR